MRKKHKASDSELSPEELEFQKKAIKRDKISIFVELLILGSMILGPTALTKGRPLASKVNKNLDLIEEITSSNNINMDYSNIAKVYPIWKIFSEHLYSSHAIPVWAKKVDINIALDLTKEQRNALQHSIDLLNEMNEKTYTNIPTLVLNFGADTINKFNIVDINVTEETDPYVPYEASCKIGFYPTFNGLKTIFSEIYITSEVVKDTANPTHISAVFLHELLHALYGLEDNYYHDNETESIMNAEAFEKYDFLSPNDMYAINAICWNGTLSDEQLKNVKEYYKYFEERYTKTDCKPIKYLMSQHSPDLSM